MNVPAQLHGSWCARSRRFALAGALLVACGSEGDTAGADADTEAETDAGESDGPSTSASASTTSASGSATSASSSTTGADSDDTTDTDADPTEGDDTDGEVDEYADYRIVYMSRESQTLRLYSASVGFDEIIGLTPAGVGNVLADDYVAPQMHADGRHLAFVRGTTVMTADVFTGETEALSFDGSVVHRMLWSPTDLQLAWLDDSARLRRASADGSTSDVLRNFELDGTAPGSIGWMWGPLGDRIAVASQPNGAPERVLWAFDVDGESSGTISEPLNGVPRSPQWSPDGESMTFLADMSDATPGLELCVGERGWHEVISHPSGDVVEAVRSKNGERLVYLAASGLFSVNADGTDGSLIEAGAPPDGQTTRLLVTDDGTWAARVYEKTLTVVPTTLHVPVLVDGAEVDYRNIEFEPGGHRLAYVDDATGQRTLRMIDGAGVHEVSHALPEGSNVGTFRWFGGGLFYVVSDGDDRPTLHHTAVGEEPLFIPTPSEWRISVDWSPDQRLIVVVTGDIDAELGRMCTFDVSEPGERIALGCGNYVADNGGRMIITQLAE